MISLRKLLVALAVVVLAVLGAASLALDPRIQTWMAHRALARRPGWGAAVGSVSAGLNDVALRGVRLERPGAVLTLPEVDAEMPVLPAVFRRSLLVRRLTARGWELDLRGSAARGVESAAVLVPAAVLQGVLDQLQLPADFALDEVDLEGDIVVPATPGGAGGRAHVMLTGGGLKAGGEGRFIFNLRFVPAPGSLPVNSLSADGTLVAEMDSARTFRRVALQIDGAAAGPKLRRGVRLAADVAAERSPGGDTYSLVLAGRNRQLLAVRAVYPGGGKRLTGTWQLDLSDDDLTPFMLGRRLPVFDGVGGGAFDADAGLEDVHLAGGLGLTADQLGALQPELADVGPVRVDAAFDLVREGTTVRLNRLKAAVSGARPILAVEGLQAFAFDSRTGELTVADASRDLFSLSLQDVPLEWGQPLVRSVVLTGGSLRGSFTAGARDGGLSLRSSEPLVVAGLSATRLGQPLLENVSLSLLASAAYTPQGWQIEVRSPSTALGPGKSASSPPLYRLDARLGRLAAPSQPVKLTGQVRVNLPALRRAEGPAPSQVDGPILLSGDLVCDFAATLGARQSVEMKVDLSDLLVGVKNQPLIVDSAAEGSGGDLNPPAEKLPELTANIRADAEGGRIVFDAPILLGQDGRQSDLTVTGALRLVPEGAALEGQITGDKLFADDAKLLIGILSQGWSGLLAPAGPAPSPVEGSAATHSPLLARATGRLSFKLKEVASPQFDATDVTGFLVFQPGRLEFDGLHASLGDEGEATASGSWVFDGAAGEPYLLRADLTVGNFDPAAVFRGRYPGRPPTVEGKFDVIGRLAGRGASPEEAWADAQGSLDFSSSGGVLHLFSLDASRGASARKAALFGSLLGDLTGAVTGRKDLGQAVAKVTGKIDSIPYDQMSFSLARDASLDTTLRDFALISPEIRLRGRGVVGYVANTPLLERPLTAQFALGARGDTAQVFKLAGVLGDKPDDLGYYPFTEPLKVEGTLGKPDTSELQSALFKDLYKNSGASDFLDKFLGK